jgi:hypothetical protein
LDIAPFSEQADFLLRLNEETIKDVNGATYVQVEEGVYLITATQAHVEIDIKEKKGVFFYEER